MLLWEIMYLRIKRRRPAVWRKKRDGMAIKRAERRGEFRARDGYGKWHTVVVFQQIIDASTAQDRDAEMPGMKVLQTVDGRPVHQISDGVYEIVGGPTIRVASGDSGAP